MPLSTHIKTISPHPVQLLIYTSKPTLWGSTTKTLYNDDSMLITIALGTRSGFSPAIAAHEAHHAVEYIMKRGDWRDWATHWLCSYQKEETHSALIESIVRGSMAFAIENNLRISNPNRNLYGMIISQQPKENEDGQSN